MKFKILDPWRLNSLNFQNDFQFEVLFICPSSFATENIDTISEFYVLFIQFAETGFENNMLNAKYDESEEEPYEILLRRTEYYFPVLILSNYSKLRFN